ncbi:MAG: thioredoxin family protein [Thiohalobacterales bacterium]
MTTQRFFAACYLLALISGSGPGSASEPPPDDFFTFDDQPLEEPLEFPDWFKLSFLDLGEDVREAREAGKSGIIVYFGQKYCPYCKTFLEKDLALEDIRTYLQKHFDMVGIDIHGDRMVTDLSGNEMVESKFSVRERTNFTPSVVFYDVDGNEALRLRGYYPPYRFRAALEYVADGHYRTEQFRDYLARADVPLVFEPGDMIDQDFFTPGPYMLDRSRIPGEQPLVVFFEQGNCHACDVLHSGPLGDPEIRERIAQFENVQLPFWGNTPVITPSGKRTTSRAWAEELGLFYTPTLIIFDRDGREIIRADSVVQFYRLRNILDYVLSEDYLKYPTFQRWRESRRERRYRQ